VLVGLRSSAILAVHDPRLLRMHLEAALLQALGELLTQSPHWLSANTSCSPASSGRLVEVCVSLFETLEVSE